MRIRALLLIDERCATGLAETVAQVDAAHVTVVAVPRLPALRQYAPLSGHATVSEMRDEAGAEAQRLVSRAATALPDTCSVEHRVLGWREVIGVLQHDAFMRRCWPGRPGRRARRAESRLPAGHAAPTSCVPRARGSRITRPHRRRYCQESFDIEVEGSAHDNRGH